jgi:hypothetical protein
LGPQVGIYFWVRVGVMVLALAGVLTLMKKLDMPGALGGGDSVDLCPTRVSSVSLIGRFAIIQDGMTWYRTGDGNRTELDQVAVEKWFGEYCQVTATKVASNDGAAPLLTLAYVSGLPLTLMVNAEGVFTFNRSHFQSAELTQAITALEHLPTAAKPGQNKE